MKIPRLAVLLLTVMLLAATGCSAGEFRSGVRPDLANFFNECRRENIDCMDVGFEAIGKTKFKVRNLYFSGRTADIGRMLDIKDGVATNSYPCANYGGRKIQVSSDLMEWKDVKISTAQDSTGNFCVERFDLSSAKSGDVVSIEYVYSESRKNGYVFQFNPSANAKIKVAVSGDFSDQLYVQSPMTSSGFLAGGIVRDLRFNYQAGKYPKDSFFVLTTYRDVEEFAQEYEMKSLSLLHAAHASIPTVPRTQRGAGDLGAMMAAFNSLGLEFHADASNVGILPRRDVDEIESSGFAHCMDAVQIGRFLATQYGLHAVPVLTGTRKPAPDITVTADMQWMDHVVLYVDSLGKFVDLTAKPGQQIIDSHSFVYKHFGIRTDTGEFILIE